MTSAGISQIIGKIILGLVLMTTTIVVPLSLIALMNYNGVCLKNMSKLSNHELVQIGCSDTAIQELGAYPQTNAFHKEIGSVLVGYKDRVDFFENSQIKCHIESASPTFPPAETLISRLIGDLRAAAVVEYQAKIVRGNDAIEYRPTEVIKLVTNCGKMLALDANY